MLRELTEDNQAFTANMRQASPRGITMWRRRACSKLSFIDETKRRTWFLFEASRVAS